MSDIESLEWRCPTCNEPVDVELDVCWNCGTSRDGVRDPAFGSQPDASQVAEGEMRPKGARRIVGLAVAIIAVGFLYVLARRAVETDWLDHPLAQAAAFAVSLAIAYLTIRTLFGRVRSSVAVSESMAAVSDRPTVQREGVWTCPDCGATNPATLLRCWKCPPPRRGERLGESASGETCAGKQGVFPTPRPAWFQGIVALGCVALLMAGVFSGIVVVVYREISARPQDADMILEDILHVAVRVIVIFVIVSVVAMLFRRKF